MIDKLYIYRSDVISTYELISLAGLHNCIIVQDDALYYILEGTPEDIESFRQDWIKSNEYRHPF